MSSDEVMKCPICKREIPFHINIPGVPLIGCTECLVEKKLICPCGGDIYDRDCDGGICIRCGREQ